VSAEITTAKPAQPAPSSQLEVFGAPRPKPVEERIDVNAVFGKPKAPQVDDKQPPVEDETPQAEDEQPGVEDKETHVEE
jgi:hypothetical protein